MTPLDEAMERLRDRGSRIAVVGASNAAYKFGNIITLDLLNHGYTVLPVNPHERQVAGLTVYRDADGRAEAGGHRGRGHAPEVTRQILE